MIKSKKWMWIILTIGIVVIVTFIVYSTMLRELCEFFYPMPPHMPKVVDRPIEDILKDLEEVLAEKAPSVAIKLQPGLPSQKIDELEKKASIELTDELRALYMWHNGSSTGSNQDFIPGHLFLSLDTTIEQYLARKQQLKSASVPQRITFNVFAGYSKDWITIFDDLFGDGYFYDPNRKNNKGCIFYHLTEEGYYFFFPSLKNLLTAITECYRQGAYSQEADSNTLKQNYEHSKRIFTEFGAECR
jgi:cell wall assembly regulator SMI1